MMTGERIVGVLTAAALLLFAGALLAQDGVGTQADRSAGARLLEESVRFDTVAEQALRARAERLITQATQDRAAGRYDDALDKLNLAQSMVEVSRYHAGLSDVADRAGALARKVAGEKQQYQQQAERERRRESFWQAAQQSAEATEQLRATERATLSRAREYYAQGKYEEAASLARAVANANPLNGEAYALADKANRSASRERRLATSDEQARAVRTIIEDTNAESVPVGERESLVYPKDWKELSARRQAEATEKRGAEEEAWKASLEDQLNRLVTFDFVETPLDQIVGFLQTLTKVNIVLDRRGIEVAGKSPATPITLKVTQVSLRDALDWLTEFSNLTWTLRKGVVVISDISQLPQEQYMVIYDVRDLLGSVPDFEGPEFDLEDATSSGGASGGGGGSGGFSFSTEDEQEQTQSFVSSQMTGEELVQLITTALGLQGQ
jgi:tetratricopeptide (TPR) repeat protein